MRFLILDTCYPAFLRAHYAGRPELARRPYAEQWRALMDTIFGTADSYSHALLQLGQEAHEAVTNCGPVQDARAREAVLRGLDGPLRLRRERSVLAQARRPAADVVDVRHR